VKTAFLQGLTALSFLAGSLGAAQAADRTPPVVLKRIEDLTVGAGAAAHFVNIANTFGLQGVTGQKFVRFTTTLGNVDVELFAGSQPKTVANFLTYVNSGAAANGGYNGCVIQRAENSTAPYIIQGGQYFIADNGINEITSRGPIPGEPGIPNTAGTIAMALSTGPDSATDAWFFNLADNTDLDSSNNGGPFTVFGQVIEDGMDTLNAIAGLETYNLSASLDPDFNAAFTQVPLLHGFDAAAGPSADDFVYTGKIAVVPVTAQVAGNPALLRIKVLKNSRPDVVRATISGRKVKLTFAGGTPGTARIVLQARDAAGTEVNTAFRVTVR
jgi:peptidyl-prolyl cis-trans isomerase A (cyclophilin A)